MRRVAILFDNFGPYHLARLKAASGVCDVLAVEFGSSSAEYEWKASEANGLQRVALNDRGSSRELSPEEFQKRLFAVLDGFHPEVVVVPGWGYRGALLALWWGLSHGVPVICMSESTQWDEVRNPIKEWIKRRIISLFSSALVGGTPHRAYIQELGMPADRIFLGYDAVDNGFFAKKSEELGAGSWELGKEKMAYFLASARFIVKKNLPRLLSAYALYRRKVENQGRGDGCERLPKVAPEGWHSPPPAGAVNPGSRVEGLDSGFRFDSFATAQLTPTELPTVVQLGLPETSFQVSPLPDPFDLILLGDGALRSELEKLRAELGLADCVQMPGFKQYDELPSYYAHAGAFIHASTTEQWGLVVNEAMASGLPVLVSNRCGCAADLVKDGKNGWTFDPTNEGQMADLMLKIYSDEDARERMGAKSHEIIAEWGPERFASGVKSAVEAALAAPRKKAGLLDRMILNVLTSK